MYSQFSVKELGIGKSTPIKLRFATDKNRIGHHGVVKRLTEMLCEKVGRKDFEKIIKMDINNQKKNNKENGYRVSECGVRSASVKSKRVISHKYPNIVRDKKEGSQPDKYFTQFFQLFNPGHMQNYHHIQDFTPYRKQESYKGKEVCQMIPLAISSRKPSARLAKTSDQSNLSNWRLSKWQTMQESVGTSFIDEKK